MTPERILIVKLGALGDLLMASPLFHALKQALPSCRITLLVGKTSLAAVRDNPDLDDLLVVDDSAIYSGSIWRQLVEVANMVHRGRRGDFDLLFCLHRDRRFAMLSRFMRAPRRIGLSYKIKESFFTETVHVRGIQHHIDHYLAVLSPLGIAAHARRMIFTVRPNDILWAGKIMAGLGGAGRWIALAPGGARNVKENMESRRWPLPHYRRLAEKLQSKGFRVLLLGGSDDRYVETSFTGIQGCHSLVGRTNLGQAAALMAKCCAVVTHDSGPMHLAGAVGVPVVSIFGPTDPREKAPVDGRSKYLWKPEVCAESPCYKDGRYPQCQERLCMIAVEPEDILRVLDVVLACGKDESL